MFLLLLLCFVAHAAWMCPVAVSQMVSNNSDCLSNMVIKIICNYRLCETSVRATLCNPNENSTLLFEYFVPIGALVVNYTEETGDGLMQGSIQPNKPTGRYLNVEYPDSGNNSCHRRLCSNGYYRVSTEKPDVKQYEEAIFTISYVQVVDSPDLNGYYKLYDSVSPGQAAQRILVAFYSGFVMQGFYLAGRQVFVPDVYGKDFAQLTNCSDSKTCSQHELYRQGDISLYWDRSDLIPRDGSLHRYGDSPSQDPHVPEKCNKYTYNRTVPHPGGCRHEPINCMRYLHLKARIFPKCLKGQHSLDFKSERDADNDALQFFTFYQTLETYDREHFEAENGYFFHSFKTPKYLLESNLAFFKPRYRATFLGNQMVDELTYHSTIMEDAGNISVSVFGKFKHYTVMNGWGDFKLEDIALNVEAQYGAVGGPSIGLKNNYTISCDDFCHTNECRREGCKQKLQKTKRGLVSKHVLDMDLFNLGFEAIKRTFEVEDTKYLQSNAGNTANIAEYGLLAKSFFMKIQEKQKKIR